jgi:glycine cleavage system H protein
VNQLLAEKPETINDDPYGEGWLVRVRLTDPAEQDALLDAAAYEASLQ